MIFDLVTPQKLLYSSDAHMVVVPGIFGTFGVLEGHVPMIASIKAGLVEVFSDEKTRKEVFFVAGGVAEVTGDRCTVLAQQAMTKEEICADRARRELVECELALDKAKFPSEIERLKTKISACLEIIRLKENKVL